MSRITFRPFAAALSLAVATAGFGAAVHATPAADKPSAGQEAGHKRGPDGRQGPRGHHAGHHDKHGFQGHRHAMMRDAVMVPGLGPIPKPVVESLKLSDAQQAKVKEAREAQRAAFKQMREAGKARHQALAAQLDGGKLDPRAILEARSKSRDDFRAQIDDVQQKWLAVWDDLDDTQRDQIAKHLKERQARMAEHKGRGEKG